MPRLMLPSLSAIAVTLGLLIATPSTAIAQTSLQAQAQDRAIMRRPIPRHTGSSNFARTELFFGTSKADGGVVSDADFFAFLDTQITPRFPDGLTLLEAWVSSETRWARSSRKSRSC